MSRWERFLHHEGIAWSATVIWLGIVLAAIGLKGKPYAPEVTLGLQEWADLATFVSAVIAPIAVLWVVRSFYVQKRELAGAVMAASLQASAFAEQNAILREDRERLTTPRVVLGIAYRQLQKMMQLGSDFVDMEEFSFDVKNTGGTAYELTLRLRGERREDLEPWLYNKNDMSNIFPVNKSERFSFTRQVAQPNLPSTSTLFIVAEYRNMDRKLINQYFVFNCVNAKIDETSKARFDDLVVARGYLAEGQQSD